MFCVGAVGEGPGAKFGRKADENDPLLRTSRTPVPNLEAPVFGQSKQLVWAGWIGPEIGRNRGLGGSGRAKSSPQEVTLHPTPCFAQPYSMFCVGAVGDGPGAKFGRKAVEN